MALARFSGAILSRMMLAVVQGSAIFVLARVLGPESFGTFFISFTVAQLAGTIIEGGMPMALLRLIPSAHESGDRPVVVEHMRAAFRFNLRLWPLVAPLALAVTWRWMPEPRTLWLVLCVITLPLAMAVIALAESRIAAQGGAQYSPFFRIGAWALVLAIFLSLDIDEAAPTLLAVGVAFSIVAIGAIATLGLFTRRPSLDDRKDVLAGLKSRRRELGMVRIVSAALPPLQTVILGLVVSTADIGTFGVAQSASRPLALVALSVVAVIGPKMALAFDDGGLSALRKLLVRALRVAAPAAAVLWCMAALALAIVAPTVLPEYDSVVPVGAILLAASAVNLGTGPVGSALQMADRHLALSRIIIVFGLVQLVAVLALGAVFGLIGAAVGVLVGSVCNNLASLRNIFGPTETHAA